MNINKAIASRAKKVGFGLITGAALLAAPANAYEITLDLPFTEATLSIEICITSGGQTTCDVVEAE